MKKSLFILLCAFTITLMAFANENPNGEPSTNSVTLGQINHPKPHFADVADPVAMYNTVTQQLTITLDAVYYPEFTICLETEYTTLEYFCFTSVVCLPTTSLGDVVDIYIESDDCGSWYGELDKTEFGGQLDT